MLIGCNDDSNMLLMQHRPDLFRLKCTIRKVLILPFPSFLAETYGQRVSYSLVSLEICGGECGHWYHGRGSRSCSEKKSDYSSLINRRGSLAYFARMKLEHKIRREEIYCGCIHVRQFCGPSIWTIRWFHHRLDIFAIGRDLNGYEENVSHVSEYVSKFWSVL